MARISKQNSSVYVQMAVTSTGVANTNTGTWMVVAVPKPQRPQTKGRPTLGGYC